MDVLVKDNFPPCKGGGGEGRWGIGGWWMASAKIVHFSQWLRGKTSPFQWLNTCTLFLWKLCSNFQWVASKLCFSFFVCFSFIVSLMLLCLPWDLKLLLLRLPETQGDSERVYCLDLHFKDARVFNAWEAAWTLRRRQFFVCLLVCLSVCFFLEHFSFVWVVNRENDEGGDLRTLFQAPYPIVFSFDFGLAFPRLYSLRFEIQTKDKHIQNKTKTKRPATQVILHGYNTLAVLDVRIGNRMIITCTDVLISTFRI